LRFIHFLFAFHVGPSCSQLHGAESSSVVRNSLSLMKPKTSFVFHKYIPPNPIMNHVNPVLIPLPYFLTFILILLSHLWLYLCSNVIPSYFPNIFSYALLISPMCGYMPHPSYPP
jgi:hypothetical protein